MKIAIVGAVGLPANYGGFETLAENLTSLIKYNHEVYVYCSSKAYKRKIREYKGASLIYIPLKANGWQSVLYDIISILHASLRCDRVLVLGGSAGIFIPLLRWITNSVLYVNTDGIEWTRPKWSKPVCAFLKLSEKALARSGVRLISDNYTIQQYYLEKYNKITDVIPYGGDHIIRDYSDEIRAEYGTYAINISRTVPENNLEMIVQAFAAQSKYKLIVLGNWISNPYGVNIYDKYSSKASVIFLPELYDNAELKNKFRGTANFYIHGHASGGSSPGLIEAMMLGLPIISFDTPSNRSTTRDCAYYFSSVDELGDILCNITLQELDINGNMMRSLAEVYYKWDVIVSKYESLFTSV